MNEDEAILYLLDLGSGASHRNRYNNDVLDKVDEIQKACGITEDDAGELKERLNESEHVTVKSGKYGLI